MTRSVQRGLNAAAQSRCRSNTSRTRCQRGAKPSLGRAHCWTSGCLSARLMAARKTGKRKETGYFPNPAARTQEEKHADPCVLSLSLTYGQGSSMGHAIARYPETAKAHAFTRAFAVSVAVPPTAGTVASWASRACCSSCNRSSGKESAPAGGLGPVACAAR
jgi:hypothetical protein